MRIPRDLLGFAVAMVLSAPSAHAADLTPFRIGISAPVVTIFPVWMGEAGGFYEKEGVKVEVISMEGGTRGVQVLMSGEIQAMHVGLAPVVVCRNRGTNTVIANIVAMARKSATLTTATVGVRSMSSGTIGSATRRSRRTRATATTTVSAISPRIWGEPHA